MKNKIEHCEVVGEEVQSFYWSLKLEELTKFMEGREET